ncbi:MAG: MFS transporter [Nocardioidaceae bacterium]
MIVFGLYGGTLVDSFDRRRVAIVAPTGLWLLSIVLVVQAALDLGQLWLLYVVVAGQAACFAVSNPARQAIVPRLIRSELLPSANALSTLSFSLGFTVGPLAGGFLLAVSGEFTLPYAVDAVTYLAALYALWRLPPVPPQGPPRAAGFRSMLEGFRFVRSRSNVLVSFLVDLCAMVLAQPRALFPELADIVYGGGSRTLRLDMVSAAFRSTILQVAPPDELRGRLQGVFVVVVAGGPRLGDLAAGSLGAIIGPTLAVVVGGCACMVATTLLAVRFRGFARYDAHAPQ